MNPRAVVAFFPSQDINSRPAGVFPLATPAEGCRRWVVLAALVLLTRKPDALVNPQFWAEDFQPFFVDAHTLGARVILSPYNGYLHLLPRLIAWMPAPLHAAIQPAAYFVASLLVTLGVVAQVVSTRVDLPAKPWLALALVTVPHTGEVFLNVTNLQWITALALIVMLFQRDAADATEGWTDAARLVAAGLTGPFGCLLLPLFILRAWRRKTSAAWRVAGILAVPAVWQGWHLAHAPAVVSAAPWHLAALCDRLSLRLPLTLLAGSENAVRCGHLPRLMLGAVFAGAWILMGACRGRWREARSFLLVALSVVLLAGIKRVRPDTWADYDTFNGDRYFYGPKVLMLWIAIIALAEIRAIAWRAVGIGALLLGLVANLPQFRCPPLPDLHWAGVSEKIQAGERVEVPINPGWNVVYPGRPGR